MFLRLFDYTIRGDISLEILSDFVIWRDVELNCNDEIEQNMQEIHEIRMLFSVQMNALARMFGGTTALNATR